MRRPTSSTRRQFFEKGGVNTPVTIVYAVNAFVFSLNYMRIFEVFFSFWRALLESINFIFMRSSIQEGF